VDIGEAIRMMRQGCRVRRPVWENGVDVWLTPGFAGGDIVHKDHLTIRCRDGEIMPWTPLSWDLLALDYEVAS
jgi:hypothetical protein